MKGQPLGLELRCLKKFKGAASLVSEEDEKSFFKNRSCITENRGFEFFESIHYESC